MTHDTDPVALLAAWDDQQTAYIAERESRFTIMTELLTMACGDEPVIVDLACGPGSLSARVLDALPGARVVAVDFDPVLLDLAAAALKPGHDGRLTLLETDLATENWSDPVRYALDGTLPSAFVSTTALHWLTPEALLNVYRQAADLLPPGGILLNGDHFRFDARSPTLRTFAAVHDRETQVRARAHGAQTWDSWWDTARARPGWTELAALRDQRFADRSAPPPTAIDFHLAALTQAGFTEVGTVWQLLDDYVVLGVR